MLDNPPPLVSKELLKSILDQMPEAAAIRERGLP